MTRDALVLDYQPRHCLRTGDLMAVEAILRSPMRRLGGAAGPNPPAATDRSLVRMLGESILQTACAEAKVWDRPDIRISVKLLGPHLRSEDLCQQVGAALAQTGLSPELLEIAIPEPLALGLDDDAVTAFAGLRDIGVNLLLDEFGHAVASLVALRDLPLTALKCDRLMLRGLPTDHEALALTRAVIETSHAIGLSVCADGVDLGRQRATLESLGLDEGQGMIFSPPLPASEMRLYLQRRR